MAQLSDVVQLPNQGWDERILVFRYQQVVTSFAVISARYVVLIDTLVSPETAQRLLAMVDEAVGPARSLLVVNTHADWDHCWGNALFAGPNAPRPIPIIGHRRCRDRLLSVAARATLAEKRQHEPQLYNNVKLVPPTLTFEETLTIDGGDLRLELIPTAGHTPDHVAVYIPQIATLFPGDAAEEPLPLVDTPATLPQLRASLVRLRALGAQTVLPCHAIGVSCPSVVGANIAYFDTLEQRCRDALSSKVVPLDLGQLADIEALIGYPFAEIPGVQALDAEGQAFYREAHHNAARAMLSYLRATS